MPNSTTPSPVELLLRTNRRSLIAVLALVLLFGATLIAHAIRPGSLLADWPSKVPWLIPVAIVLFVAISATLARRRQIAPAEVVTVLETVLEDEFRQANLARAQRLALIVVLVAQLPLAALALTDLPAAAAVTIMAITTVMIGMVTLIGSFLFFDRE